MGKEKTKSQKKSRISANQCAEEGYGGVPHSFVFNRGQVGKNIAQLVQDMRRVMEPFTAESLKVRKKNVLKDFVSIAGPLGVSHFMIFSKTPGSISMRLARLPKGPTLHFRVIKYTLIKDVVSSLKRHRMHEQQFTHHPLLILNNFASDGMQVKLMATMFQNMFPSINVHKVSLNNIKRCILLNYNPETEEIEFRHYSLKVVPVGMSRGVKKLMQEKFPNMSKFEDISELLMKGANLSESEAEQDGEHNITELPQVYAGRGNMASQQSAVRLTEIGPRLTLQLVKIQEGMGDGDILYHAVITKTEEEIQEILARKEAQLKAKEARRRKQEADVAQKLERREENKRNSLLGIKRKRVEDDEEVDPEVEHPGMLERQAAKVESDDEEEYYREAVGQEPDEDMFPAKKIRLRDPDRPSSRGRGRGGSGGRGRDGPGGRGRGGSGGRGRDGPGGRGRGSSGDRDSPGGRGRGSSGGRGRGSSGGRGRGGSGDRDGPGGRGRGSSGGRGRDSPGGRGRGFSGGRGRDSPGGRGFSGGRGRGSPGGRGRGSLGGRGRGSPGGRGRGGLGGMRRDGSERKFGGSKTFGKKTTGGFKSMGQKGKPGFKKSAAGGGTKHKKGKG